MKDVNKKWVLFISVVFPLVAFVLVLQLFNLQFISNEEFTSQIKTKRKKFRVIEPKRGNIFDTNGELLVSNNLLYNVYFDPVSPAYDVFYDHLKELSTSLASLVGKYTAQEWENKLTKARKHKKRYVPIAKKLTADHFEQLKQFPIFNKGKYRGGLITEVEHSRKYAYGEMAKRTLGWDRRNNKVGLEGFFTQNLSGIKGRQYSEMVAPKLWRPVPHQNNRETRDGDNLYTTLDIEVQDIVHHALLNQLVKLEADHGTAVVMEVATGKVRAMSNLGKTEDGSYFEARNYAVWEQLEPGSTFKLFSLMAALEDGVVDTSTIVNTYKGVKDFNGVTIKDSKEGGYGKITVKRAFEVSSNIGVASIINEQYRRRPEDFVDRLYKMGVYNLTGIEIPGEMEPKIPHPKDKSWSGISLQWMSWGYGLTLSPLQILTIYNGVANYGKVMKPTLVEKIVSPDQNTIYFPPQVVNSLSSQSTISKLHAMMRGVVTHGTAAKLNKDNIKFAGKTGTTQFEYWKGKDKLGYLASFVGYFPYDKPKYSCIVVVSQPKRSKAYYGSDAAGPVFYRIAEKINVHYSIDGKDDKRNYYYWKKS